jgi:hypothetical protein
MPTYRLCKDEVKNRNENTQTILENEGLVVNHYMGRYVLYCIPLLD